MSRRNTTVVAELQGGLGNQLFQYTAAHTVANRFGGTPSFIYPASSPPNDLSRFLGAPPPEATTAECLRVGVIPRQLRQPLRTAVRVTHKLRRPKVVYQSPEGSGPFAPMPAAFPQSRPIGLMGYFQHPSWYQPSMENTIDLILSLAPKAEYWQRPDVVAINYRRGDYVRAACDLPLSYYEDAVTRLGIGSATSLAIVADDHVFQAMVEDYFRRRGFTLCHRAPIQDDDFWTSAGAGSVIMSNSTYCWWATVIGDHVALCKDRQVVFPHGWIKGNGDVLRRDPWTAVAAGSLPRFED